VTADYRISRYRSLMPELPQPQITRDLALAVEGLQGRWYTLTPQSVLAGQTLAEADVRRHTGATIMEIRRRGHILPYPGPEVLLTPGDRVLVVGDPQERTAFEDLLQEKD